jgi:hypothetical protein
MTEGQLEVRRQRAQEDVFVITAFENGWRVRSARNPSKFYLVSMNGAGLRCTCPDFEQHVAQDPAWQCKHLLAVQGHQTKTGAADPQADRELAEERIAVQAEGSGQVPPAFPPANGQTGPFQMLIKRSISPDGRIDSISIEFAFALDEATANDIKSRALKTLTLQTEIVKGFLHGANGNANIKPRNNSNSRTNSNPNGPRTHNGNGGVFARLLDVGVSNGQYGERLYLNFQVNGRTARLFGTAAQIANAIAMAGERLSPNNVAPGLRLDLPCRVLTEQKGQYVNVTRVLPLPSKANAGVRQ